MKKILLIVLSKTIVLYAAAQENTALRCPRVNIKAKSDTICGSDFGGIYSISAISNVHKKRYRIRWTTSGTGSFYYQDTLNTIYEYSPSDAGLGQVWLRVTITDKRGTCPRVSDSFLLKLNDPARIDIDPGGVGLQVCPGDNVLLDGGVSGTANTVYWSTSGTGTFTSNPAPVTTYIPSFQDLSGSNISISGVTNDPPGVCPAAGDYVDITVLGAVAFAGNDTLLCGSRYGGSFPVSGITNSPYEVSWSTNGFGYFDDPYSINTNYNYDPSDVGLGNIELYLTVFGDYCSPYTDTVSVVLNEGGWLEFPEPYIYQCSDNPYVTASVYLYGYPSSGVWTSTGSGSFDDPTSTYTTYKASKSDIKNGCVDLIFTTNDPNGPCGAVSGFMTACFYDCGKTTAPVAKPYKQKPELLLYPNPATNTITLKSNALINHKESYITDASGKIVYCKWNDAKANTFDISKLSAGLYFLHITYNGEKTVLKFIKQ